MYRRLAVPACLAAFAAVIALTFSPVLSRAAEPDTTKLAATASLVLTPEFCATKTKKGSALSGKETFEIGKAACAELEPALQGAFAGLTRVDAEPSMPSTQLVLIPKLVDVNATKTVIAFSDREMIVLIEWTVKDAAGKKVWIETVQGSAKHHSGNMFTYKKNLKLIVNDSVKDAAAESAIKMAAAPELRAVTVPRATTEIEAK